MSIERTCREAIDESIRHDRIAHIDGGPAECDYLESICEASVENGYITEFWGVMDGADWRVHVCTMEVEA